MAGQALLVFLRTVGASPRDDEFLGSIVEVHAAHRTYFAINLGIVYNLLAGTSRW